MSPGLRASLRPSMLAPIWRSGSATRRIGRLVNDASPKSSVSNRRPAQRPMSKRMEVPELPQSSGWAAARRPSKPTPWTIASRPTNRMSTPRPRSAVAVERLSPPRPRPDASTVPPASAPNSNARCEIDLSPGTVQVPCSGPERRTRSTAWSSVGIDRRLLTTSLRWSRRGPSRRGEHLQDRDQLVGEQLALAGRDAELAEDALALAAKPEALEDRAETEELDDTLAGDLPDGVGPDRRRGGGGARVVEHGDGVDREVLAEVEAARGAPERRRQLEEAGGAGSHALADRQRDHHRALRGLRAEPPAQLAELAGARVGYDAPGGVDRRADGLRVALRERARRDQRDGARHTT